MSGQLQLIEPVPIDDDLCSGVALIEDTGVGARLVFYAEQTNYESNTEACVIKRKIVVPIEAFAPLFEMAIQHLIIAGRKRARDTLRLVT
jgi:hypothetical protein